MLTTLTPAKAGQETSRVTTPSLDMRAPLSLARGYPAPASKASTEEEREPTVVALRQEPGGRPEDREGR